MINVDRKSSKTKTESLVNFSQELIIQMKHEYRLMEIYKKFVIIEFFA